MKGKGEREGDCVQRNKDKEMWTMRKENVRGGKERTQRNKSPGKGQHEEEVRGGPFPFLHPPHRIIIDRMEKHGYSSSS